MPPDSFVEWTLHVDTRPLHHTLTVQPQKPFVVRALLQFKLRQEADDILYTVIGRSCDATDADDAAVLHDYFNLSTSLVPLAAQWAAADDRFRDVSPYIPGLASYPATHTPSSYTSL